MKKWIIPGGLIPLDFDSSETISILNLGEGEVVKIFVYHTDKEPVGPYEVKVESRQKCKINLANLIDPEALILDEPYSLIIETPFSMLVQFTRRDTTGYGGLCGSIAYSQQ